MKVAPIIDLDGVPKSEEVPLGDGFDPMRRLRLPVWVFDIDQGRIAFANQSACRLWGAATEAELCARDMAADMSATVANRLRQYQTDFERSDATFTESWTLYPNDQPRTFLVVFRGYMLPDGRVGMQCEAVGESEDEPSNLRSAEALLHTDVLITLFDRDGPLLYQNPASRNGYLSPVDQFSDLFVDPDEYGEILEQVDFKGEHRVVAKMCTPKGTRWFDVTVKRCTDAATGDPAFLATAIDVSELKEARDTARFLANRDQLTNLHNRSYLQSYLTELERSQPELSATLILFDVDRFKQINDRYGHGAGDAVLRQLSVRARSVFKGQDLIARLGGDEFVILIEGERPQAELDETIERLRLGLAQPVRHGMLSLHFSISVGVTTFTPSRQNFADAMREADIALYASKQAGRDRVMYFTPQMGAAVEARKRLEEELRDAITNREFELHYQPRVDVQSGKVVGAEGLLRWRHPTRGLVPPGEFIPACEETGMIEEVGRQVLETGCAQAIEWQKNGMDVTVSLNVSPKQFADPTLLDNLAKIAADPEFPKGKIELEITENVLIGDHSLIADRLKMITEMGFLIAIDDFGTGYSNLSYISRFPLTCLKIDRSFIDQLPDSGPIVNLILTLGQEIGARVVSEGVETQEQMDWLYQHKCAEVQGFLITRPLPLQQFEAFTQDHTETVH